MTKNVAATLVAVSLALWGAIALAAHVVRIRDPEWYSGGIYIGTHNGATAVAGNKVNHVCRGTVTSDFGTINGGNCALLTEDGGTSQVTLSNCAVDRFQATCAVSAGGTADDGGVQPWATQLASRCNVMASDGGAALVNIRLCAISSDGGTYNPGPGPFSVTVVQ